MQVPNVVGFIEEGKKVAKKQMDITLHGLWGPEVASPLQARLPRRAPIPLCNISLHMTRPPRISPIYLLLTSSFKHTRGSRTQSDDVHDACMPMLHFS